MEYKSKNDLMGHLLGKARKWHWGYLKAINNEDEEFNKKYTYKHKVSRERLKQHIQETLSISNFIEILENEDELNKLVNSIYKLATNEEAYKEWKSEYNDRYYREKRRRGDELTQEQINKNFQAKRKNKSKTLVYNIAYNFKGNDKKITANAIYEFMQGLENGLGLTQCKKYLKELRDEDKI
ncbi:MAG: hypothetical protein U9N59_15180 [Campylobacterota bacterium]|nr:hypothetical protein [Campylobacterota bacterium]